MDLFKDLFEREAVAFALLFSLEVRLMVEARSLVGARSWDSGR